ncbi:MAG: hypothetical protein M3018_10370, partial [Actinomycetota bacterium]|nr:hypothetical protein [Actinomycetota bacterium]
MKLHRHHLYSLEDEHTFPTPAKQAVRKQVVVAVEPVSIPGENVVRTRSWWHLFSYLALVYAYVRVNSCVLIVI